MDKEIRRTIANCYYRNKEDGYCRAKGRVCNSVCGWHDTKEEYEELCNIRNEEKR